MPPKVLQPPINRVKLPETVASLLQLARQLGPGARLPRMNELCRAMSVTLVTIDQALRQLEQRGLIERHRGMGIYVSRCIHQKAVGLVLGWNIFSSPDATFYSILSEHCVKRAAAGQERFSFFLDAPDLNRVQVDSLVHQDLVDALDAHKLDGLLLASGRNYAQEMWLRDQGVPVVSLNDGSIPHTVCVDYAQIIRLAAQELMRQGCRSIGLIAAVHIDPETFRRTALELGFHFEESWIVYFDASEFPSREIRARECARTFLEQARSSSSGQLPEGLISTDDILTRGACAYFQTQNVAIDRDLKIATHANKGSAALDAWNESLILCEVNPEDVAEAMFSMLEALMDGRPIERNVIKIAAHLRVPGSAAGIDAPPGIG